MVAKKLVLTALALVLLVVGCNQTTPLCDPHDSFFFSWSYNRLEELSGQVQTALDAAGVTEANAYAEAYGEDKMSQRTGALCEFLAMETDFHVTLQADTLTDPEVLGTWVEKVLTVLDEFPPEKTPGPQPGYVSVTFEMGEDSSTLRFRVTTAADARDRGLKGAILLEALGRRPEE